MVVLPSRPLHPLQLPQSPFQRRLRRTGRPALPSTSHTVAAAMPQPLPMPHPPSPVSRRRCQHRQQHLPAASPAVVPPAIRWQVRRRLWLPMLPPRRLRHRRWCRLRCRIGRCRLSLQLPPSRPPLRMAALRQHQHVQGHLDLGCPHLGHRPALSLRPRYQLAAMARRRRGCLRHQRAQPTPHQRDQRRWPIAATVWQMYLTYGANS